MTRVDVGKAPSLPADSFGRRMAASLRWSGCGHGEVLEGSHAVLTRGVARLLSPDGRATWACADTVREATSGERLARLPPLHAITPTFRHLRTPAALPLET